MIIYIQFFASLFIWQRRIDGRERVTGFVIQMVSGVTEPRIPPLTPRITGLPSLHLNGGHNLGVKTDSSIMPFWSVAA